MQLIEKKQNNSKEEEKKQQTIDKSIPVMMCLKTVCTAPAGASRPIHFKATHAPQYHTFIKEQWEVVDPGRKEPDYTHIFTQAGRQSWCMLHKQMHDKHTHI